jgi:predicted CXXCH cytochrome family protein
MTIPTRARRRTLIGSGVFVLITTIAGVMIWRDGRWRGSGEAKNGGPSESITAVARAAEIEASRKTAREWVAAGHFDDAFAFYRNLEETQWHADDCLALGSALLKRDRLVLGWAAIEAARRCDPKPGEAVRAADEMDSKLAKAKGHERFKLREAADRLDFLRAIPGGPPLGLFVAGMARYASNPDQDEEFLDRLGARDRAVLRGVTSITAATALIARLLMETGRASEAFDLLQSLVLDHPNVHAGLVSRTSTLDAEAAWLLSRAALQLDRHETADLMLVRARDFGKRAGSPPEPAPFVGSKLCGECHGKIFSEQQGASRHALTLRFGSGLKDVPLPERPVPDPIVPSITHGISRKQDDRIELESRAGDQVFKAVVAYAVGSGRHGITMLATDEQGIVRELRVSYFGENASWGETKGINFAPREASDHIGLGLSSQGVHHCLQCHTTWFRSIDQNRSGTRGPEGQDRGIGCERCHGPGLNHVKAVRSGFPELAIALTSKAPSSVRLKSCAECHAADGSIPLNDPEFTRAQGTTFLFSRCYTAMKDQFGCTTCHDPHRSAETSTLHYEAKCLTCHGSVAQRLGGASSSRVDDEKGRPNAPSCPVNATAKCISCHMPKVDDPSRRSHFTDHHIRVHRTAASERPSL